MTKQHPITPPPDKLVEQWREENLTPENLANYVATQAARWGADQELQACCEWFLLEGWHPDHPNKLRAARRPKPQNLKEQALEVVTGLEKRWDLQCDLTLLRRALEQLDD